MDAVAIAVGVAVALIALGLVLVARRMAAYRRSRAARRRGRIAVDGERAGAELLRRAGYDVLDRQVAHQMVIEVDGDRHRVGLRCDYLVERGGHAWVAEIKTGAAAPSLTNPATRRQLLEYQVAYSVAGVVLVDATAATVREIRFDLTASIATTPPPRLPRWPLFVAGLGLGAALVGAATRWL